MKIDRVPRWRAAYLVCTTTVANDVRLHALDRQSHVTPGDLRCMRIGFRFHASFARDLQGFSESPFSSMRKE